MAPTVKTKQLKVRNKITKKKEVAALHRAANCGDLQKVMELLCKGVDVNAKDKHGETVLHKTVEYGDLECVKLLVSEGVDVNIRRNDGATAVHLAAYLGLFDFVTFLIDNGADVNAKTEMHLTPLHLAVIKGQPQVVKLLLNHGANVNAVMVSGQTPLHIAVSKSRDCISVLIEKGADIFFKGLLGISPLEIAEDLEVFKKLLPENCDVCAADGTTAIHVASRCVNYHILDYMIEKGCDVNVQNKSGDTPLHFACLKQIFEVPKRYSQTTNIALLLEAGANKLKKNNMGLTPVHVCAENGSVASLDYLHKFGCDLNDCGGNRNFTPLHFASEAGHLNCIKFLIDHGVDKSAVDTQNCTALMLAAKNCHFDCVKFLLEKDVPFWVT